MPIPVPIRRASAPPTFPRAPRTAYPTPDVFAGAPVEPAEASWNDQLDECVLPYEAVRSSDDPAGTLLRFPRSTDAAAADAAGRDRDALECEPGRPGVVRPVRPA